MFFNIANEITKSWNIVLKIIHMTKKLKNLLPPYCCFSYAGNWELVKSFAETKFRRSHVCLHCQAGIRLWQLIALLFLDNFYTKADTGGKVKYSRLPKNTDTQQQNTKENSIKTTEINWDWSKKISWSMMRTCEMSLLLNRRF